MPSVAIIFNLISNYLPGATSQCALGLLRIELNCLFHVRWFYFVEHEGTVGPV